MFEDWELIEASFAMQYQGKNLYDDEMDWKEFSTLLAGITKETPLGQMIAIRSEENRDVIKNFTEKQKEIRNEWRERMQNNRMMWMSDEEKLEKVIQLQNVLASAFHKQHSS